jgi:hypothetical protein
MEVMARLEADLGRSVNPLEGLLRIGADESQTISVRMSAMIESLPYIFPKLQQQSVALTGPSGGPVEVASLDVATILADPKLADAAQQLALMIEDQERLGLPEPEYTYLKNS